MENTPINPTSIHKPLPYYNQGLIVPPGRLLFISGQVGLNKEFKVVAGGIEAQTVQTFENIKAIVEEAGGDMSNIVSVTVYLKNIADGAVVSEVRMRYFSDPLPTSTGFAISEFVLPDLLVEVTAIASLPLG